MVHRHLAPLLALLLVGVATSPAPSPTPAPTLLQRLNHYLLSHGVHPSPHPKPAGSAAPPAFALHGSMMLKPHATVRVECGRGFIACQLRVVARSSNDARLQGILWGPRGSVVHLHVTGSPRFPRFWFSVDDIYASRTRAHAYIRAVLFLPRSASLQFSGTRGEIAVEGLQGACRFDVVQINVRAGGCGRIEALSESGNVAISFPASLQPPIRVSTVGGSITMVVPRSFAGRVHARSVRGAVENALSGGRAGAHIDLASISGGIWVRRGP